MSLTDILIIILIALAILFLLSLAFPVSGFQLAVPGSGPSASGIELVLKTLGL